MTQIQPEDPFVAELKARLQEAEETLDAIRNGDVDAVVVGGPAGQQVYTLENADRPYRVLIEQMQEGAVTFSSDGTVLYCNQRFATIADMPRELIVGGTMNIFFASEDYTAFKRLLGDDRGTGAFGEFTLLTADGDEVPVNISLVDLKLDAGMPRLICGVVTDLTLNRRRSSELAAANARLASEVEERRRAEDSLQIALDAAGMGSWDLDLVTGLARRSLRHDQIFGHTEMLPHWNLQSTLEHFLPEDRDAVEQAFAHAQTMGALDFQKRIKRANDETVRWLHCIGRTYYEDGKPARVAGVVVDVTDLRHVEEQLRQAQKMEAVGQLTGGIAHDFNNLLMIIGGSLEMLRRHVPSGERPVRFFDAARQGVERGAKLNEQLLAFSRRQDLRVEAVRVEELLPTFEHLLDRAIGETIKVSIDTTSEVKFCKTDAHQLETAILNLAINARDAMPNGGKLTLATGARIVDPQIAAAHGTSPGEYVVVSVADTGIGMPPEILTRVFEPFFTTKEVGKGTGLGLSQVYGFAKQSGGFVIIESELGQGTKVCIYLPGTPAPPGAFETDQSVSAQVSGEGVVLLVEDDADVRATASSMLQELGYTVREADTGHAALDLMARGAAIDLVFSDVIMPDGMSGIELVEQLEMRHPGLPVLLTSGYTAQRIIPDGIARKVQLLRKPYSHIDLSKAVRDALSNRVTYCDSK